jgi:hypothetical protein
VATAKKSKSAKRTVAKKKVAPKRRTAATADVTTTAAAARPKKTADTAARAPGRTAARPARKVAAKAVEFIGLTKSRRVCKHVLDALHKETDINGGGAAEADVIAFRNDPGGADTVLFGRVSSLPINRWYVDPSKPNEIERKALWVTVRREMQKIPTGDNPDNWTGQTTVLTLGLIADAA